MAVIKNQVFEQKATACKRPLKHRTVRPVTEVIFEKADTAFQKFKVVPVKEFVTPYTLNVGDSVILDFGDHCVGYLHFALNHFGDIRIVDSPLNLKFTFGEFPLEIETPAESYSGTLGKGWLQNELKSVVFTPYSGSLERRYAFRYVKIERVDSAPCPIQLTDIYVDSVSAVELCDASAFTVDDSLLQKIYDISLKTLKECEQDVFEDGPKRDRRLWIGDLRLQALADYESFRNLNLIKRCIYLFAAYRNEQGLVAPCVFPDSPPCIDGWVFIDYSLYFVSCLHDYVANTKDWEFLQELYPTAAEQVEKFSGLLDKTTGAVHADPFIDWCADLDKEVAILGVYLYVLRQFVVLTEWMEKETGWILDEIEEVKALIGKFFDKEKGMFITSAGQLSWHSQIWAVISEAVDAVEGQKLIRTTLKADPAFMPHTPYMMHCYLEALDKCGMKTELEEKIKDFWGQIVDAGFDCCPEIFNPADPFESPYLAPEINSACHAWSCTPVYWIKKYFG